MAKIILESQAKSYIYTALRDRTKYVALSTADDTATNTFNSSTVISTNLTGLKEIKLLNFQVGAKYDISSDLVNGIYIFTVKSSEVPKNYLLLSKHASNNTYKIDIVIGTGASAPAYDTARQLRSLKIEIKGDGETI